MKKLVILGANDSILPLIEKANSLGYETHVFSAPSGSKGESIANFFYPIDLKDREQILEKCKTLNNICGVCSITSDFAAPVVNYIARELGLPCNPQETEVLARNKYKMRCALKDAGLYTPKFYLSDDKSGFESKLKYPVIVKPTDRWSSAGVTRVNESTYLLDAIENAKRESLNGQAIIEEYMEGPEYSAECICYKGTTNVIAITQKFTTGFPHYVETGHMQPPKNLDVDTNSLHKQIISAISALRIRNSAAHVEFKVLDHNTIGIIEIGARMGGGCIGTHLTPLSTGVDYIKNVIDVACGIEPNITPSHQRRTASVKFVIDKTDMDLFEKLNKEIIYQNVEKNPDFSKEVLDNGDRHGCFVFMEGLSL